jgi:hypothetical protein
MQGLYGAFSGTIVIEGREGRDDSTDALLGVPDANIFRSEV